ncbi:protein RALF-like 33 [Elaeis guineensis]|uniref:Protein RALF-like 33 n=1 Tax=Elaeis guineensis var. tenera TaxID=51953 RepID=A0A6I9S6L0_ELAGV|nr:protein RALF-like 33 [Elaeis guineensis]
MAVRSSLLSHFFLLLAASIALLAATSEAVSASAAGSIGGGAAELGWIPGQTACRGTVAECIAGDEFDFESEISRRILASWRYISYNALRRDSVPCSRRGASYYNCRPGAYANPYHRGCSAITRCRR